MTGKGGASSRDESPAFFEADDHALFGILTAPTVDALGVIVIVVTAAGTLSADRNRVGVRLCRHVAGLGFHAMRFDYRGTGESEGDSQRFRLDEPFTADLMGAVDWARKAGLERVVLVGSCFGSRTALACAPYIDGLEGLVLMATPVRDYEMGERIATGLGTRGGVLDFARHAVRPRVLRGLFDADKRRAYARITRAAWRNLTTGRENADGHGQSGASPLFLSGLGHVVRRSVPTLLVYGSDEDLWRDFDRARSGRLGELLAGSDTIELLRLPGEVHGYKSVSVQDEVIRAVSDWLRRFPWESGAPGTREFA
jgi:pimeloyl-ACP methyl ester carboxylesterase